jgi:hypothetical protein
VATTPAPAPIDARAPRFNQAVLAVALLVGFVTGQAWVIPVWAVVLFLGAAFGARCGPFLRLWRDVLAPRAAPPRVFEDPRPPRFAAVLGTVFLGAASAFLIAGVGAVAWGLASLVAALAALSAITGLCVGCEVYILARRHTRAGWTS